MKKRLLKVCYALSIALLMQFSTANAQQAGDYRTVKSGNWGTIKGATVATDIWETYTGSAWVPTTTPPMSTVAPATSSINKITIRSGHVVTLNGTTVSPNVPIALTDTVNTANNLVIENDAVLKSGSADGVAAAAVKALRIGNSISLEGTGMLGTTTAAERVTIEVYNSANNAVVTFTGPTGATAQYNLVDLYANSIVTTVAVNLNGDMNMSGNLRGYYNITATAGQDDDNVTININKTVTLITSSAAAYLHGGSAATYTNNLSTNFGNYTYNINDTLVMTATGTSCIVAPTNVARTVTVNTNGTWRTGNAMRISTNYATGTPMGDAFFNIGNGGVVDAITKPTNLVSAPQSGSGSTKNFFFNITGTGVLKRNVASSSSGNNGTYPIGSNGTYTPVTLTTSGTAGSFSVRVNTIADQGKKIVKKVYKILPDFDGATNVKLSLGYTSASDLATGYDTAAPAIYYFDSTAKTYTLLAAVNSGTGTPASPNYATTPTAVVSTFGSFVIGNETPAVLPLNILDFTASLTSGRVVLNWTTANEINTRRFTIERSTDGSTFNDIGEVASVNTAGVHIYSFTDVNPGAGINYYRLKQTDIDGAFKYSSVVIAKSQTNSALSVYVNSAMGNLLLVHSKAVSGASISLISISGQKISTKIVAKNSTQTALNIGELAPGSYVVVFENGLERSAKLFIK